MKACNNEDSDNCSHAKSLCPNAFGRSCAIAVNLRCGFSTLKVFWLWHSHTQIGPLSAGEVYPC
jgi:hypothetical protein